MATLPSAEAAVAAAPAAKPSPTLGRFLLSAVLWAWVGAVGFVSALAGILLFPFFNPWVDPRRRVMDRLNHLWGSVVLAGLPRIWVHPSGLEHLSTNETFLVCANHQSVADIVALLSIFKQGKFVSKRGLFWTPPLGISIRLSGYVRASLVEDGSADRMLTRGVQWLRRGCHLLVFPEGTRSPDGKVGRFRKGPFVVAQEAGVRVLPVAIHRTRDILPKGSFLYGLPVHARVELLEPVTAEGDLRTLARNVRDSIQQALNRESGS